MKRITNPYLPSWEYIPDGEPYVFGGRVYVYGSHDRFNGHVYCLNDYVCWSAPEDDLGDWRYEGVIYKKTDDPLNRPGDMCLYAPDVTVGSDGRYYLYYVLDKVSVISVAVCNSPAGKYEFYGYVCYKDGARLGEREGDEPQFDPGVLTEGEVTYLYTGFCPVGDTTRSGAMAVVLDADMLTVREEPVIIAPSEPNARGSGYEGHEFFEAPSIRKYRDTYYFVYSSVVMHELCYATSKYPTKGFQYGGVIVSNNDLHIDTYKPAERPMYYGGNNHGSIVEINGAWHIFYHRHTNGTNFSRQGCREPIQIMEDGSIPQVEMTSCGGKSNIFEIKGDFPSYLACNLFTSTESIYTGGAGDHGMWMDSRFPKITQDESDGEEGVAYIANMTNTATAGYKYFNCKEVKKIIIRVRGYCEGEYQVKAAWNGDILGRIPVIYSNVWKEYETEITLPDELTPLYFTFSGRGSGHFGTFTLV